MLNKNKILKKMKDLEKQMVPLNHDGSQYRVLNRLYRDLSVKIGVVLPDSSFIRTIKPCSCKSVKISINTEKGKCQFKCVNCGICSDICANEKDARDNWNDLVKLT